MKKTLIWIASVIGTAAVLTLGLEYFYKLDSNRTITVSGECLTTAPKDRTAITIRVQVLDKNAAVSMKRASGKMEEITKFLKTQDVEVQTTRFDSYEKTEWNNTLQKSVTMGIETTIAIEVSAKKTETIEAILAKFAGTADVYSENLRMFTSAETMKPIMEKCLGTAIKNARERANAMAKSENRKIGKLLSAQYFSSSSDNDVQVANFMNRATKMESASFGGGLVSKDTEISVGVGAVFEIK
ncbi:MAG: SIMPL domain-containing protein [Alphaproteobacteria bacterium]|jgi:uncharacterized protein YggE|nr:SIMPL domain-containing protein [Alphaproteobacteria bacterium]